MIVAIWLFLLGFLVTALIHYFWVQHYLRSSGRDEHFGVNIISALVVFVPTCIQLVACAARQKKVRWFVLVYIATALTTLVSAVVIAVIGLTR